MKGFAVVLWVVLLPVAIVVCALGGLAIWWSNRPWIWGWQ